MYRIRITAILFTCTLAWLSFLPAKVVPVEHDFSTARQILLPSAQAIDTILRLPCTVTPDGKLKTGSIYDWRSGFFGGNLWLLYDFYRTPEIRTQAMRFTRVLEPLRHYTSHHDLGFMVYCSYGNAYRLTRDSALVPIIIDAAASLCTRFNPKVGCIKSWNVFRSLNRKDSFNFPVIIDNMMNLELLMFAWKKTGEKKYYDIAVTHANTTLKNHFRPDFSSYHVVAYDSITGQPLARKTAQGFSDNSAWARGQAWALYGYTMMYRFTKLRAYLNQARGIASFIMKHPRMPQDKITYWDFNAGQPGYVPEWNYKPQQYQPIPRDASAAAIIASALLELGSYGGKEASAYRQFAVDILSSLSSPDYLRQPGKDQWFLLSHSTGHLPGNAEVDVPLVYADYYFLEALLRYRDIQQHRPLHL